MTPLIVMAALGAGVMLLSRRKEPSRVVSDDIHKNLAKPGAMVRGKSGTVWEVKTLKVVGDDIFHTVFTRSGTKVITYKSKRGVKNATRHIIASPPGVDKAIVRKAVSDFGLDLAGGRTR